MIEVDQAVFISYINSITKGGGLHTIEQDGLKLFYRDTIIKAKTTNQRYYITEDSNENRQTTRED